MRLNIVWIIPEIGFNFVGNIPEWALSQAVKVSEFTVLERCLKV